MLFNKDFDTKKKFIRSREKKAKNKQTGEKDRKKWQKRKTKMRRGQKE